MEPPVPIQIKFTFFEVRNYKEFIAGTDDKPLLVERGPYTYREDRHKRELTWSGKTWNTSLQCFIYNFEG